VIHRPQEEHADLGLVDDDNTEEMRRAPVAADALRSEPTSSKFERKVR
jgi:hypothetical protein